MILTKEELKPIDISKYRITETGQVLKMTKEEKKDEMKNKISMALKDQILQQGFEIICKNLAELEQKVETERNCRIALVNKITKLEKENAELDCQKNRNRFCYSCANATERCFRNEIGCPCEKYKSYKDENAELKKTIEHYRKEREFFISEVEK